MRKIILALILVAVLLVACAPDPAMQIEMRKQGVSNVERYIDKEYGVVCYIYNDINSTDMECFTMKDSILK